MRWLLAGVAFALTVALAIGTAAIRADNIRQRLWLEREYRRCDARWMELNRLSVQALEEVTPERLAMTLRALLGAGRRAEAATWQ